jgi:excisionase family DNA binding protein
MARKLTRKQVAKRYHVVERTVTRWTNDGRLPQPFRIGRGFLYDESDLETYERGYRVGGKEADLAAS